MPAGVVSAQVADAAVSVTPGGTFEVSITLTIKPGYHIYANPADSEDVPPTRVTVYSDSTTA